MELSYYNYIIYSIYIDIKTFEMYYILWIDSFVCEVDDLVVTDIVLMVLCAANIATLNLKNKYYHD